jgi:ankyrin repeat protein
LHAAAEQLFDALEDGDLAALGALLRQRPRLVEARDEAGLTPLMRAVLNLDRDPRLVEQLLAAGADPRALTEEGESVLHLLVDVEGDGGFGAEPLALARPLVAAGADLEARQADGLTPLLLAVLFGTPDEVAALVQLGARTDVLVPADFDPPHLAGVGALGAALGSAEKLRHLLAHRADPRATDAQGRTPVERCQLLLDEAVEQGDLDLAGALEECRQVLAAATGPE